MDALQRWVMGRGRIEYKQRFVDTALRQEWRYMFAPVTKGGRYSLGIVFVDRL
jgi:hypothetical protein